MTKAAATITWINHASYLLKVGEIGLLTDPWFDGSAFNNGWELLSPFAVSEQLLAQVTHIWISHEHPDHFSIASLKKFSAERRKQIQLLFQKTRDQRVVTFCRKLGFQVRELPLHELVRLDDSVSVICGNHRHMDSWLLTEYDGKKILNINDCSIVSTEQAQRVARYTGTVDLLFTQFGYANWIGNPEHKSRREKAVADHLEYIRAQCSVFQPKWVVPFASFVRFSNVYNRYLNAEQATVHRAVEFIQKEGLARPVALYPGDTWNLGSAHDNRPALEKYAADYSKPQPEAVPASVPWEKLKSLSDDYVLRVGKRNNRLAMRLLYATGFVRPIHVRLRDTEETATFDALRGLRKAPPKTSPDFVTDSDSLAFCLKEDFGAETLYVNGRYESHARHDKDFFRNFYFSILNNQGYDFPMGAAKFVLQEKVLWRFRLLLNGWLPKSKLSSNDLLSPNAAASSAT